MLWYRVWFQPCAFTMMPRTMCDQDPACDTFCDQENRTTPSSWSSAAAYSDTMPLIALSTFVFCFWPLMDFHGQYHVSVGARVLEAVRSCTHDQLSHLQGGRPVLTSYIRSATPQMSLFGVGLSPVGARFVCAAWLSVLLVPFVVFKGSFSASHSGEGGDE